MSRKRKLWIAYLADPHGQPVVAGIVGGIDEADARRLFAAERGIPRRAVTVRWTPNVTFEVYAQARQMQIDFMAENGGGS